MILFIDSTYYLSLGLLDESYNWLAWDFEENRKGGQLIHEKIHNLVENSGLKITDIKNIVTVAGPGSYTGIRLSEGIGQVFDWQEIQTNSFYHFEVPRMCGKEEGLWICEAYKKEFFVFEWDNEEETRNLIPESDLEDFIKSKEFYTHFHTKGLEQAKLTSELIHSMPENVIKSVINEDQKRELFYFRPLEKEFKTK